MAQEKGLKHVFNNSMRTALLFQLLDKETEVQVCKIQCQKFSKIPVRAIVCISLVTTSYQPLSTTVLNTDFNHLFLFISTLLYVVVGLSVLLYLSVAATL